MKADKENSVGRYKIILALIVLVGIYIISTAVHSMLPPNKEYWEKVSKRFTNENIELAATRGNILDCNGMILSGSVPEYRLYIDFLVKDPVEKNRLKTIAFRDSVFTNCLDSIADGLAKIFPDKDAKYFRAKLEEGKREPRFSFRIYPKNATYIQYRQCKELPLLRESPTKGGFHGDAVMQRKKPYGSLASRTIGDMMKDADSAKCGLELSYDSILKGKPGISHKSIVRNSKLSFIDKEPEDGHDLKTTIDIKIQDAVERALRNKLHEVDGELGMAAVMEVKTGDIKAISNLTRGNDGQYYEMKNNIISDLMEPGSTFKTASIMVAMEDGYINKNTRVDTEHGICTMYRRQMKDHNWRKGGYGELSVTEVLGYSSNIGVSKLIDKYYHDDPDRYVCGLNKLGVGIPLNLKFKGKGEPLVRHPVKQGRFWKNWSNTALPWMSIGYETMIPPISTLTFYNAIANGGKMVKPRFVTAELEGGNVVREFPTETIIENICKPSTLSEIQEILEKVVSEGLGKKAGNGGKLFKVSGKTGTAQIAAGKSGYHSGITRYMVSFCGYFPSEAPLYSCIVCIVKTGLPASGGGQCGPVFREISEHIMANHYLKNAKEARDYSYDFAPTIAREDCDTTSMDRVPDVCGMGAKDAVHELQKRGLKVKINGTGRVKAQSIPQGTEIKKPVTITLQLGETFENFVDSI